MTEVFDTREQTSAEAQAEAQYSSICGMLDAYELDWDRLEELRGMKADHEADMAEAIDPKPFNVAHPDEAEELETLEAEAGESTDQDDAQQQISEDPLSVEVRSGWTQPYSEQLAAEEFRILLCTGGPAVQIRGELDDNGTPSRAWLEYQDWGTPWTQYFGADNARLVTYAQHFFG
jgi:hypothetical protein